MENIIAPNQTQPIANLATGKAAAQQTEAKVAEVTPPKESANPELNTRQDTGRETSQVERRLQLLKRLANLYAVSDTRFTIYKNNGEYFTRVTNLRDGTVSVVPEPELLSQIGSGSVLKTSV